jgi:hypothetical protein
MWVGFGEGIGEPSSGPVNTMPDARLMLSNTDRVKSTGAINREHVFYVCRMSDRPSNWAHVNFAPRPRARRRGAP